MSPPLALTPLPGVSTTPSKNSTPRTSLSPPESASRAREGRTPPPAPSAAYARRAREIMEDEGVVVPVVSVADLGGEVVQPGEAAEVEHDVGFGGYRRPRAGTMPSKLNEAEDASSTPTTPEGYVRTSALSPAYPGTGANTNTNTASPSRPALRHAASSTAGVPTVSSHPTASPINNRPRSGSLGLPQNALGSAFGNGAFSKSWLANPSGGGLTGPARSPLAAGNGNGEMEHPYSPTDMPGSTTGHLNFSTLDYLGLAEGNEHLHPSGLAPASMAEVRTQAQKAIAASGPASRIRASTVSNFARPLRQSVTDDPHQYSDDYSGSLAGAMETLAMYDHAGATVMGGLDAPYGYREPHRPRAITVGTLDNPRRPARGGYLQSIPQSPNGPNFDHSTIYGGGGYGAYTVPPRAHSRSREGSLGGRGPRLSISSQTSRTGTPDFERGMGAGLNPQVPTRSLWIGNLDVDATSDSLLMVFAQYGPIESVRMLPEKVSHLLRARKRTGEKSADSQTCAFVNYIDKLDAVRARDDVLNRLGGHITSLSETAPVRIGFGKIDSAPVGLNTSTVAAPPPGLVFTTGNIAAAASTMPAMPLSPEQLSEQSSMPTRALWIGSIPAPTSSATLLQIFSPFGPVESARVLQHKCCGFINFERLDSAVSARNALNGRDILGSDVGPIRIGYARVPTKTPVIGSLPDSDETDLRSPEAFGEALSSVNGAVAVSTETQLSSIGGGVENYRSPLVIDLIKSGVHEQVLEKGTGDADGVVSEESMIMQVLSKGQPGEEEDVRQAGVEAGGNGRPVGMYYSAIPTMGEMTGVPYKRFDAGRLKDYRKRLESGIMTDQEVDVMAVELLEDSAELAADHIGNTVIQKLYERVSPSIRFAMLERIAPHLAMVGVHKNGTWAAQKIIECSITPAERQLIALHLRPFAPPLMCDSLGNYVCAGTLRFGAPYSDYVFDAMADRMWDIAQNRFGARCMRTCLESAYTSLYQKKRISTGIILNAIPLSTNPNGALLLTWLVDQSNLPGRYGLLANRFAPHVAHLCTHKLASLTVLRIISQTSEPAASAALLAAIFTSSSDSTLVEILTDANNGSQIIGKILATSTLPPDEKDKMTTAVRRVLPGVKASNTPPYRLLLEAVGLPVPASSMGGSPFRRENGWQARGGYQGQGGMGYQGGGGYHQPHPSQQHHQQHGGQGQNLGLAPVMGSPNLPGSPRTPVPQYRGRLSPASSMMSPGSDPFNPFASPSIDMPYLQAHQQLRLNNGGMSAMQFEQQPNLGGLGFMNPNQGMYYQQSMGIYGRSGGFPS